MSDELEPTVIQDELPEPPTGGEPTGGEPTGGAPPGDGAPPQKPDDLRSAMAELAGTVSKLAQPKEEPARQPTPEEVAQYWGIYDPEQQDKEFFKKFGRFGDDATPEQIQQFKELFAGMQKGLMRQAIQGARNFIAMEMERLNGELGPIREYVEDSRREAVRGRFYGAYPGLDERRFDKITEAVARTLAEKTFDDEDHYFKELAEGSANAIKELIPDFDIGKTPEKQKTPGQTPRLPRTSAGGGGGAGKGRLDALQPTGSKNDIDSLDFET